MIELIFKHHIYETAINIIFDKIIKNFNNNNIIPKEGTNIEITFYDKKFKKNMFLDNALVQNVFDHDIAVMNVSWKIKSESGKTIDMNENHFNNGTTYNNIPMLSRGFYLIPIKDIISWQPSKVFKSISNRITEISNHSYYQHTHKGSKVSLLTPPSNPKRNSYFYEQYLKQEQKKLSRKIQ